MSSVTSESAADKKVTYFTPAFPVKDIQPLPINALLFDHIDGSLRPGRYCSHGISRSEMHAAVNA